MSAIATIMSVLVTSLMNVLLSVCTASVADKFMRRVLIHAIEWIVKSTHNEVDDDMAKPILDELKKDL